MSLQGQTLERTGSKIKEPKRYNVVMLNDDFTTMDFVVEILIDIFHKEQLTAEAIMLDVHKKGKAVVGTYSYDIAMTKTRTAMQRARDEGLPFRMLVEEA